MIEYFDVREFPALIVLHKYNSINYERVKYTGDKNLQAYEQFCYQFVKEDDEENVNDKKERFSMKLKKLDSSTVDRLLEYDPKVRIVHVTSPLGSDFPVIEYLYRTYE